jgi:hypothetical protein
MYQDIAMSVVIGRIFFCTQMDLLHAKHVEENKKYFKELKLKSAL